MPYYIKMVALLFEAAAAGCLREGGLGADVALWSDDCHECEVTRQCPARSVIIQAKSIEAAYGLGNCSAPDHIEALPIVPLNTNSSHADDTRGVIIQFSK